MYNLSRLYREAGDTDKEREFLDKCLETDPRFPLTYFYLARIYLNRNERYEEAIDAGQEGDRAQAREVRAASGLLPPRRPLQPGRDVTTCSEENALKGQAAADEAAKAKPNPK